MQEQHPVAVRDPVIFVVDDDVAVRSSLKFSLEIEGFSVKAYPEAANLLAEADLPSAGCLVLDYNLPGMNGLALLKRLRERGISMPALLITTHPSLALRERAAAAGIRIIEKPLLNNALLEGLREALARLPPPD